MPLWHCANLPITLSQKQQNRKSTEKVTRTMLLNSWGRLRKLLKTSAGSGTVTGSMSSWHIMTQLMKSWLSWNWVIENYFSMKCIPEVWVHCYNVMETSIVCSKADLQKGSSDGITTALWIQQIKGSWKGLWRSASINSHPLQKPLPYPCHTRFPLTGDTRLSRTQQCNPVQLCFKLLDLEFW